MSVGSWLPNPLSPGLSPLTVCPAQPVNKYPDVAEKATPLGLERLRAITFTPCAGVIPSWKNTEPERIPYWLLNGICVGGLFTVSGYSIEIQAISSGESIGRPAS